MYVGFFWKNIERSFDYAYRALKNDGLFSVGPSKNWYILLQYIGFFWKCR